MENISKKILSKTSIVKFYSTYYFFKIIGLAPMNFQFKLIEKSKKHRVVFSRSSLGVLYNILLAGFAIRLSYNTIHAIYIRNESKLSFDKAIDLSVASLGIITVTLTLITFCIQEGKVVQVAMKIETMIVTLKNIIGGVDDNKFNDLWMINELWLATGIMWFLKFGILLKLPDSWYVSTVNNAFGEFVIISTPMQYSLVLNVILHVLRELNADFGYVAKHVRLHYGKDLAEEIKISKFMHLRDLFWSLCAVSEEVSDFYSQPILFCISYSFATLILFCYFIIKSIFIEKDTMSVPITIYCVIRFFIHTLALVTLTKSATSVVSESKRTRQIIIRWIENSQHQQITSKLCHFSLALLNQKIKFSAADLFLLDKSLLMSIFGSIITYMMIILQFTKKV